MSAQVVSREHRQTWRRADGRRAALALLDYSNLVSEEAEGDSSLMRHFMVELVRAVTSLAPQIEYLAIRAYGGWLDRGSVTSGASKAMRALEGSDPFPIAHPSRRAILHGEVRLANALLSVPEVEFVDTYRVREGPPRIRLAGSPVPGGCASDPSACPAAILKRFTRSTRKNCPASGCAVTCGDAFKTYEQKMVDTLIACDLVEAGSSPDLDLVALLTCDTDLLPPLVYASSMRRTELAVITPDPCWRSHHVEILNGIGVHLLPAESSYVDTR